MRLDSDYIKSIIRFWSLAQETITPTTIERIADDVADEQLDFISYVLEHKYQLPVIAKEIRAHRKNPRSSGLNPKIVMTRIAKSKNKKQKYNYQIKPGETI